jgi:tetratricopeptide (TPR) repeat protein
MRSSEAVAAALALAIWAAPSALDAQEPAARAQTSAQAPLAEPSPLSGLRRGRDAFMAAREFSSALAPAESIVDAQRAEREPLYPADLAALGLIRAELRDLDPAIENLSEAADLVVKSEGEYSPTLIEYYRGLGRTYIKAGQYQQAIVTLEQAQHITQRHLGLFNVEQAGLLDDITTAYLGLGNTVDARRVQIERLDNAIRRFGPTDPRVIPFRYTLARYYERSRLPESAREQYEEVLSAQEARLGGADAGLLSPLRELVQIDMLVAQGEVSEQRDRLAAVLEQSQNATPVDRGLTLALLGDWATVTGDTAAAADYYREAWRALSAQSEVDVAEYFRKPTMIDFVPPLSSVDRGERSKPYTWGEIVLEFDVTAEGLPSDVRVISRDARLASLQTRYNRRMRETHFRPRLVGGEPVATSNVRSTHYVRRYLDNDEEEAAQQ